MLNFTKSRIQFISMALLISALSAPAALAQEVAPPVVVDAQPKVETVAVEPSKPTSPTLESLKSQYQEKAKKEQTAAERAFVKGRSTPDTERAFDSDVNFAKTVFEFNQSLTKDLDKEKLAQLKEDAKDAKDFANVEAKEALKLLIAKISRIKNGDSAPSRSEGEKKYASDLKLEEKPFAEISELADALIAVRKSLQVEDSKDFNKAIAALDEKSCAAEAESESCDLELKDSLKAKEKDPARIDFIHSSIIEAAKTQKQVQAQIQELVALQGLEKRLSSSLNVKEQKGASESDTAVALRNALDSITNEYQKLASQREAQAK